MLKFYVQLFNIILVTHPGFGLLWYFCFCPLIVFDRASAVAMPRCYMVRKLGPKMLLQRHTATMDLDIDECSSRSGTESPPPFTDPTSVKLYKPLESVTISKHKSKSVIFVVLTFYFFNCAVAKKVLDEPWANGFFLDSWLSSTDGVWALKIKKKQVRS